MGREPAEPGRAHRASFSLSGQQRRPRGDGTNGSSWAACESTGTRPFPPPIISPPNQKQDQSTQPRFWSPYVGATRRGCPELTGNELEVPEGHCRGQVLITGTITCVTACLKPSTVAPVGSRVAMPLSTSAVQDGQPQIQICHNPRKEVLALKTELGFPSAVHLPASFVTKAKWLSHGAWILFPIHPRFMCIVTNYALTKRAWAGQRLTLSPLGYSAP